MALSQCVKRLRTELAELLMRPLPNIHVKPHEDDVTRIDALVIGPEDTPYADGFFHFDMRFPPEYPFRPPRVLLLTTDGCTVRFNPNLYAEGKVCLSILGTWEGPGWRASHGISTVLLSIQSVMNEKPYHNEPGYEDEDETASGKYNDRIQYETLRVAVVNNVAACVDAAARASASSGAAASAAAAAATPPSSASAAVVVGFPPSRLARRMQPSYAATAALFREPILRHFLKCREQYLARHHAVCGSKHAGAESFAQKLAQEQCAQHDQHAFEDPFGDMVGKFSYKELVVARLRELAPQAEAALVQAADVESDDEDVDEDDASIPDDDDLDLDGI